MAAPLFLPRRAGVIILAPKPSFSRTSRQLSQLGYRRSAPSAGRTWSSCCLGHESNPRRRVVPSSLRQFDAQSLSLKGRHGVSGSATAIEPKTDVYEPPTSGLLGRLPKSWVPYAELIRLDKPAGTLYLFMPCLFSTLLAAPLASPMASPGVVLGTSALFLTGALVMRGAGCTINDLWDRNLDRHVTRTRLRPIARGAVSVQQAIPYLGFQLLLGLGVLLQFRPECLIYGVFSLPIVALYPLAKRVTNYPQFVLGLAFSWGAFMGFPALGVDLLTNSPALISSACLYASCISWTLVYDMIYAYQDIRDDAKAGIKSIALAQAANAKTFLSIIAGLQVSLLAGAGAAIGAGPVFFVGTCGGAALTLQQMIRKVNLDDIQDCWRWFRKGAWFTGGAISLGLFGEYVAQYTGAYDESAHRADAA